MFPFSKLFSVKDSASAILLSETTVLLYLNVFSGTKEERGITAWQVGDDEDSSKLNPKLYNEGYEVYSPLLPQRLLRWKIVKYIPFLPHRKVDIDRC